MNLSLYSTFVNKLIELAIEEDIGRGDISCIAIESCLKNSVFEFKAKEDFILCGIEVAKRVFKRIDENLEVNFNKKDGDFLTKGETFGYVKGFTGSILMGERTALNFLQRLSGIATNTGNFVKQLEKSRIKIIDTRKTTPGHRVLEKYAVFVGGGSNHRFGLFDGIMLKDNHIDAVGSISEAVRLARLATPVTIKIEVETRNLDEVKEAVEAGSDIIMLDNFDIDMIKKAVKIIKKRAMIEVSGGVNLKNLHKYKKLKIDYISIGALTHQATSVDISLKFCGAI